MNHNYGQALYYNTSIVGKFEIANSTNYILKHGLFENEDGLFMELVEHGK